ncbi:MAG: urease accessory protein UreF [Desulfovibrio sp.]|jgi:urease accessory protein|nr:urease accessory protein UreF [Desulfovibrio sp.]
MAGHFSSFSRLLPLLYLASPALPVGAFAFSQGLAPACANSFVDGKTLAAWLKTLLFHGLARLDIPVLLRCHDAATANCAAGFFHWNAVLFAGRESAELWFEEEQIGRAMCRLLRDQALSPEWMEGRDCGHVAAFALAAARLAGHAADAHDSDREAACAYLWAWLENQVTTACKCLTMGQRAAQGILLDLMRHIPEVVALAAALGDDDIGTSLPGLAIASSLHEHQYSRMFRS